MMKIKVLIKNPQSKFIFITFIISAIGFLKTFFLLKLFDFDELGLMALAQTFISSIGLMQIGVVTGGYRLFSYKKENALKNINSAVLIYFIILGISLLFIGGIINYIFNIGIDSGLVMLFILIGILSLYSNWVICKLLGVQNIVIANKAQLGSTIISFLVTISAKWFGFPAVIAGLVLQPVTLIAVAYIFIPKLIPRLSFVSFKKYIKKIISLGFIPYLTSALGMFNSQLGRWLITFSLGTIILGKTFLPTLFVVLISVFPGAISNLFFPKIIEKFEMKERKNLDIILKRQFAILGIYYFFVIIATLLLADSVIIFFLPKHYESVYLIYAILPSLIFIHLSGPSITFFNAAKKFNHILIGGLISIISYGLLLFIYLNFLKPQLVFFYIIESISTFIFFVYNSYYFLKLNYLSYDKTFC